MRNQRSLKSLLGKKKKKPFHTLTAWLKIEIGLKTEIKVLFPLERLMEMLG